MRVDLPEEELASTFLSTLKQPYTTLMITLPTTDFNTIARTGARIESAIKSGQIHRSLNQSEPSLKPNPIQTPQ